MLANVDGAMNAVVVCGNAVGPTLYYGAGAGEMPTASAVVGDLMEISREIKRGAAGAVAPLSYQPQFLVEKPVVSDREVMGCAYVRLTAKDEPKVIGDLTAAFGSEGVGIATLMQREAAEAGMVSVIIMTRNSSEAALRAALLKIEGSPDVKGTPRVIRIEEGV